MHSSVMVVVPPTVGHVNHGIALANLLARCRQHPVLVTGGTVQRHLRWVRPEFPYYCLPSHDILTDRSSPHYRPHLEQLCDPERVVAAATDQCRIASEHDVGVVVNKDYFASIMTAEYGGAIYVGYYTDGVESLVAKTNRQTVTAADRLTAQLGAAAAALGLPRPPRPVPAILRSDVLNIVRGFRRTSVVAADEIDALGPSVVFAGALTYDARPEQVRSYARRLRRLARPVIYVTFGTVLQDRARLRVVAQAAPAIGGTVLVATDNPACLQSGPENLHAETYVPNQAALAVADVVIHHGGHGTMLSALTAGVPQVVVPDNPRTNQAHHGAALTALGVGCLIDSCAFSPEALTAAVRAMADAPVRARAQALGRGLRRESVVLHQELLARLNAVNTQ